jgi:hypothetical protein
MKKMALLFLLIVASTAVFFWLRKPDDDIVGLAPRLSAFCMEYGVTCNSATHERRLLAWTPPTNELSAKLLSLTDKNGSVTGWWRSSADLGNGTTLAIEPIISNRYLLIYFSSGCDHAYRLERHAYLNDGVLRTERPIGDWSNPYNELLLVPSSSNLAMVSRTIAESTELSELMAGKPYYSFDGCFYRAYQPQDHKGPNIRQTLTTRKPENPNSREKHPENACPIEFQEVTADRPKAAPRRPYRSTN